MNKTSILIIGFVASFSLGFAFKTIISNKKNAKMKKVTGIGGVFFKCKDPKKVNEWYKNNLGFDTTPYGTSFEGRGDSGPNKKALAQWNPFPEPTKYFEPSVKEFIINSRVENIEALIDQLRQDVVTIV